MIILHCAEKKKWDEESKTGSYGNDYIKTLGYIPCMNPEDITPDNFSFSSMKDYLILCIDTDKVTAEIKAEINNPNEFVTTNIYGPLNINAISTSIAYTFDSNDIFVMTKEIEDIIIVNDVVKNLKIKYDSYKYFHDGTSTRIILLNNSYVIRQNNPKLLESEVTFLNSNTTSKLQSVVYTAPGYKYVVYNFIAGDVMHTIDDVDDLITNIKEITTGYSNYDGEGFGYLYDLCPTWENFLKTMVHEYSLTLPESFNYLDKVYDAISELKKYPFDKKIIHGDFGTHNFIKQSGKFVAAIDPTPIVGDPLYDILYALMSNVDLLSNITINFISQTFSEPPEKVKALLTVVLFCRFAICLKHHKEDIDKYVNYWFEIIEK